MFVPNAEAIYSEHYADGSGTCLTEQGRLHYVGPRLSYQTVPLQGLDPLLHARLVDDGTRLAEAYRALGYRGHLTADAITTPRRPHLLHRGQRPGLREPAQGVGPAADLVRSGHTAPRSGYTDTGSAA
ncbi:hypothetical protein ACIOMM_35705 [Streptomyces sp. NPDC087908]|uniref:hypothetical protein n=1 Tax=Streptomyces sp. NPDC087908 TaxID=3365820 RepID=UPI0038021256